MFNKEWMQKNMPDVKANEIWWRFVSQGSDPQDRLAVLTCKSGDLPYSEFYPEKVSLYTNRSVNLLYNEWADAEYNSDPLLYLSVPPKAEKQPEIEWEETARTNPADAKNQYDVVLQMAEADTGLMPRNIRHMVDFFEDDEELAVVDIVDENGAYAASGFIRERIFDLLDYDISPLTAYIRKILGDTDLERPDGEYETVLKSSFSCNEIPVKICMKYGFY